MMIKYMRTLTYINKANRSNRYLTNCWKNSSGFSQSLNKFTSFTFNEWSVNHPHVSVAFISMLSDISIKHHQYFIHLPISIWSFHTNLWTVVQKCSKGFVRNFFPICYRMYNLFVPWIVEYLIQKLKQISK